jgi:tRNA(fMet)-specific endonuclease VapC
MEYEKLLIDTSILIDYFRKKKVENSILFHLVDNYDLNISVITEFEFLIGFSDERLFFAKEIISQMEIFDINKSITEVARLIYQKLKKINKLIPIPDLFIASTAMHYNIPLATLNKKHFENIEDIKIF